MAEKEDEESPEKLLEDDEISPEEAGFMEGEGNQDSARCAHCGKPLGDDKAAIIEREYDGKLHRFCSEQCAEDGPALDAEYL